MHVGGMRYEVDLTPGIIFGVVGMGSFIPHWGSNLLYHRQFIINYKLTKKRRY